MAHPLTRFIETVTVQSAIYWGNPTPGGYTSFDYGIIKQIKVRWDDSSALAREQVGEEGINKANILVNEDLDVGGYIMLGTFGDIATDIEGNQISVDTFIDDFEDTQLETIINEQDYVENQDAFHLEIRDLNGDILLDGFVEDENDERVLYSGSSFMINNILIEEGDPIPQKINTTWHPKGLTNAFQIKEFDKVPLFRSKTDFVRTATL